MEQVYKRLESLVAPKMKAFTEDLTKFDKEKLSQHKPVDFIHCSRSSGTDLIMIDTDVKIIEGYETAYYVPLNQPEEKVVAEMKRKSLQNREIFELYIARNELFYLYLAQRDSLTKITPERARELYIAYNLTIQYKAVTLYKLWLENK